MTAREPLPIPPHATYEQEYVRCGKPRCGCHGGKGHGPYWYAYWRQGTRLHRRYIGKRYRCPGWDQLPFLHQRRIHAERLLGLKATTDRATATALFRKRILATHPDHGDTTEKAKEVILAWRTIQQARGWR